VSIGFGTEFRTENFEVIEGEAFGMVLVQTRLQETDLKTQENGIVII
jgi:hypothetical protein